ncbi:TetR/AcrR family transcriptional regulator [Alloalcanivorax marinus]|uniref:TetR/AcrR family transcriptional regulator n=1 Tax=Alloalcanivorax marinus TaxID=1177169 RepID=UPI00193315C8|nr:TetR/AcrR family transcriptional regulator [Alloalcanivorax marinus]MBL7251487.1 TetR/AcrR family transcriptional regulator [Alloalcanivorax marinus]
MAKKATPGTGKAPANTLTRGHKKKARTQRQLLDAALRIYAHAGVGGLALNTPAEEAGVSNGTVYNDFRSREQVLEAVGLELAVQLSEQILTVSEAVDSGAERLITVVHYAHEEMAMSMVISASLGAMNLLVEDGEVEHADRIAAEMVLQALGVSPEKAKGIAGLALPGEGG